MLANSKRSNEILGKIRRANIVLLDEAHLISLPSPVCVPVFLSIKIPPRYRNLAKIYQSFLDLCQREEKSILEIKAQADQGHASKNLSKSLVNVNSLKWKSLRSGWKELRVAAINGHFSDKEAIQIRDIITILGGVHCNIGFISEDEGSKGQIYLSSGTHRNWRALHEFLTSYADSASHLYVSGTLIEPKAGYFSELSGKEVTPAIYPDIRRATEKLTLIPDRWKITSKNFYSRLPMILETIRTIAERENQGIYLLTPNRKKYEMVRSKLKELGIGGIKTDYYRSDNTLGVERKERICIALGFAEIPSNAYDSLARGKDPEERWIDSRRQRLQAVHAATWQAVNRVRDPEGLQESKVYFIGCQLDQVRQVARWGINRQLALEEIKHGRIDNTDYKKPIFTIKIDQELELPKIFSEDKDSANSERRKASDLIKEIRYYNNDPKNLYNHCILPNYKYRENAAKVQIYNFPSIESELDLTSDLLYLMIVNRTDCYAKQYQNSSSGKWEFFKVNGSLDVEKLKDHVKGNITLGAYQISLDDTCKWVCDDIDSHNGESDSREKVGRVVSVLRSYSIPFLLEASGSPDSYHIWVFLTNTKTYNAYRFIRQINSEAKVDCECWPKQKSIKSDRAKHGNLVKIPICYHQKSQGRSAFLDADTFEPLEGPIDPPGLVELLEVPEVSGTPIMPKVKVNVKTTQKASTELDYCMQRALEDKLQLNGSEGNDLRLAIAVKAQLSGMEAEKAALLFKDQTDYDYEYSLKKVLETWSYNYAPYSCSTLQDKCNKLVRGYCLSCPFSINQINLKNKAEA